jgi:hypothetical protein
VLTGVIKNASGDVIKAALNDLDMSAVEIWEQASTPHDDMGYQISSDDALGALNQRIDDVLRLN